MPKWSYVFIPHYEVRVLLGQELTAALRRIDALLGADWTASTHLRSRSIPNIITPTAKPIGM
ncbi:MAG: hypothetical protein IT353_07325 [Gemmatimonadaceae bacterium]|nr:hypothetical protein [Gemmatimonadaceae bacterium]